MYLFGHKLCNIFCCTALYGCVWLHMHHYNFRTKSTAIFLDYMYSYVLKRYALLGKMPMNIHESQGYHYKPNDAIKERRVCQPEVLALAKIYLA